MKQSDYGQQARYNYGDYYYNNAIANRQEASSSWLPTSITDIGRGLMSMITYGYNRMATGLRRVLYNDFDSRQDFFGLTSGRFFSSGVWLLPTAVVSTGLLLREEINTFVNDIFGRCRINNK